MTHSANLTSTAKQSNNSVSNQQSLSQFGKFFQERVVQALLVDKQWAATFEEVVDVSFFETNYLKWIVSTYYDYHNKYKDFPAIQTIVSIVKQELTNTKDDGLREDIATYLNKIIKDEQYQNYNDLVYFKEKAFEFCKMQKIKGALADSIDLISTGKFDAVLETMKRAIMTGERGSSGHDIVNDLEKRYVKEQRSPIATGFEELDKKYILNGGLGKKEIGCVIATSGTGKSLWLVQITANALRQGKNIAFYTFELSESAIGIRVDSNLCDINSNDIRDSKDVVIQHYEDNKDVYGRLIIKEYPTRSATVVTIRSHLEKLSLTGFKPDMVVVDYADIMRSTSRSDLQRQELQFVFEELRALAMELDVPIWTATQSNRDGLSADVIGMGNMAESYGKAMVCDLIISLNQKEQEKASNRMKLFIAKNRAGQDGGLFSMLVDKSRSYFRILTEAEEDLMESASSLSSQPKDDGMGKLKKMYVKRFNSDAEEGLSFDKIVSKKQDN